MIFPKKFKDTIKNKTFVHLNNLIKLNKSNINRFMLLVSMDIFLAVKEKNRINLPE